MTQKITDAALEASISLAGQHAVVIHRREHSDRLELFSSEGRVVFSIEVSERGPVLSFEGSTLTIRAVGDLELQAQDLSLRGERSLSLQSGGDLNLHAQGDLHSVARAQHLTAELGDVRVDANDDVRIDGERVLVNC